MSAVNEALIELARSKGLRVFPINTAPASTDGSLRNRASRWGRIFRAINAIFASTSSRSSSAAYFSVSGGWGIMYEIALVGLARSRGARIILHHHSFRYLDSDFAPMRWLSRAAGSSAVHVVLCPGMGQALATRYSAVERTLVLTNAAFLAATEQGKTASRSCRVVGHLSNLSVAKGLLEVIELARLAQAAHSNLQFKLAGPFEDSTTEALFHQQAAGLTNLQHLGPLYGSGKMDFFRSLDAFVFPTRYRNEAEPLVIHEALSQGCPVLALDRGCISALVDESCGLLVPRDHPFASAALALLQRWQVEPLVHEKARRAAAAKFEALRQSGNSAKEKLLSLLRDETLSHDPSTQ